MRFTGGDEITTDDREWYVLGEMYPTDLWDVYDGSEEMKNKVCFITSPSDLYCWLPKGHIGPHVAHIGERMAASAWGFESDEERRTLIVKIRLLS